MIEYSTTSRYYKIKEEQSIIQIDLINLNLPYQETVVRSIEVNNPELLSQRVYNNPHYWWVICQFNGIIDPKNIPLGMKIKYPILTNSPRENI